MEAIVPKPLDIFSLKIDRADIEYIEYIASEFLELPRTTFSQN